MKVFLRRIRFRAMGRLQVVRRNLRHIFKNEADLAAAREHIFSQIYRDNAWGHDDGEFYSGVGSRGEVVDGYIAKLTNLLTQMKERNGSSLIVVDIGCGDFYVGGKLVQNIPDVRFIGCDIVKDIIISHIRSFSGPAVEFKQLDITREPPPEGDVYLVRQVFQHLSNDEIERALGHLIGKTVIVTESHPVTRTGSPNPDKVTGKEVRFDWWTGTGGSVELSLPPFNKKTIELFRLQVAPNEVLITEQVFI